MEITFPKANIHDLQKILLDTVADILQEILENLYYRKWNELPNFGSDRRIAPTGE